MKNKSKDVDTELTPKQIMFCREYILDLNATQAAIRAGYTKNERAAAVQAARLLTNAKIGQKIQEFMNARAQRIDVNADFVLGEILKIASADIGAVYNERGTLRPIHEIPEAVRRAIASIDVFEEFEFEGRERTHVGDTKRVKFWDKTRALELLGKHLKLFTDKLELNGSLKLEDLVAGSNKSEGEKP